LKEVVSMRPRWAPDTVTFAIAVLAACGSRTGLLVSQTGRPEEASDATADAPIDIRADARIDVTTDAPSDAPRDAPRDAPSDKKISRFLNDWSLAPVGDDFIRAVVKQFGVVPYTMMYYQKI
jgi:hypothetical protein